jgi:hypothetical protein
MVEDITSCLGYFLLISLLHIDMNQGKKQALVLLHVAM